MDILTIISSYAKTWPEMEPIDVIKMLYQINFGCEHIIEKGYTTALKTIKEELKNSKILSNISVYDYIGQNWYHLNLNSKVIASLPCSWICNMVFFGIDQDKGTIPEFKNNLTNIFLAAKANVFNFSENQAYEEITTYVSNGIMPPNHSKKFHTLYHPSYRIVQKKVITLLPYFIDLIAKKSETLLSIEKNCSKEEFSIIQQITQNFSN